MALRRFNAAVGLHRSRPVVMNLISTPPSGTAFRMRAANSIWIAPPNIPCVGDKSKIDEGRGVDVFINKKFVFFGRFGHRFTSLLLRPIQRSPRSTSRAPRGRALGMKRHLAVVRWSETSGAGKRLFNSIFISAMLRVG